MRTERHIVKHGHPLYALCDLFCFKAKNAYNSALYICRQEYFDKLKKGEKPSTPSYTQLWKQLSQADCAKEFEGNVQSLQQSAKLVVQVLKSFCASTKDYNKNPGKYKGRPKLPRYKHKVNGRAVFIFTNHQAKEKNGKIYLPKALSLPAKEEEKQEQVSIPTKLKGKLQQVRIVPRNGCYIIEIIKLVNNIPNIRSDNGRYLFIDFGVCRNSSSPLKGAEELYAKNNLCAVANNFGAPSFIIDGRGVKSINEQYIDRIAYFTSKWEKDNKYPLNAQRQKEDKGKKLTSKRIDALWRNRNNKIEDCLHKASRKIVDFACKHNVSRIIYGHNVGHKHDMCMGNKQRRLFAPIPFDKLSNMITYKAMNAGIGVIETEEKYTSGTSFLDHETPTEKNYKKSRRIRRGLFRSNTGRLINADINAAAQIGKKMRPKAWDKDFVRSRDKRSGVFNANGSAGGCGDPVRLVTHEAIIKPMLNPGRLVFACGELVQKSSAALI